MTSPDDPISPQQIKPRLSVFRDAWRLAWPFFKAGGWKERTTAVSLAVSVTGLNLLLVYFQFLLNYWNNEFYNALQAKNGPALWDLIGWYMPVKEHGIYGIMPGFTEIAFVYIMVAIYRTYLSGIWQIRWREQETRHYINDWLSDLAYYFISLTHRKGDVGTDNPDQRIQEDLRDFIANTIALVMDFISNVALLAVFIGVLWNLSGLLIVDAPNIAAFLHIQAPSWMAGWVFSVPGYMVFALIGYALLGTLATHAVGKPLQFLNFMQQRYESDFRFAAARVREYAEGIALMHGEEDEKANLMAKFDYVVMNWWQLIKRTKLLNVLTVGYAQAAIIFPIVLALPRYLTGALSLGGFMQVGNAFGQVQGALSWFVSNYGTLAAWCATVDRLAGFQRALVIARAAYGQGIIVRDSTDGSVRISDLNVDLPTHFRLLANGNVEFKRGTSVVVTGASGSGKSTLFRAMAGIWPFGSGTVFRPAEKILFIPQKSYVPFGTLRYIVCYPLSTESYSTEEIVQALTAAGLGNKVPNLDVDDNWWQTLSGGEQQRMALARALLFKPDWLFLDEATASLDPKGEEELYLAIKRLLPNTTVISIAHRPAVAQFHDERLELQRVLDGEPGKLVRSKIDPNA